jgi:hypothetical protein
LRAEGISTEKEVLEVLTALFVTFVEKGGQRLIQPFVLIAILENGEQAGHVLTLLKKRKLRSIRLVI